MQYFTASLHISPQSLKKMDALKLLFSSFFYSNVYLYFEPVSLCLNQLYFNLFGFCVLPCVGKYLSTILEITE